MAAKTFLSEKQLAEYAESFKKFDLKKWQQETQKISAQVSAWAAQQLKRGPDFEETRPIFLGSMGREELCPYSDLDLLFLGEEKYVKAWMTWAQENGLKVRARMPQNQEDWSEGVEAFDVISLMDGRALHEEDQTLIEQQKKSLKKKWKTKVLKAIQEDRQARQKRFGFWPGALEPHLKYGRGGLRDGQQVRSLKHFFDVETPDKKLAEAFDFVKLARLFIHQKQTSDIMSAEAQEMWREFLKKQSIPLAMRDLQQSLADIATISDQIIDGQLGSKKKRSLWQHRDQQRIENINSNVWRKQFFNEKLNAAQVEDAFWSQSFLRHIPEWKRVRGWSQPDQYHKYALDTHLMLTLKEMVEFKDQQQRFKKLKPWLHKTTAQEWTVLLWAALYHDLGKGLHGDHSVEGEKIVLKDMENSGLSKKLQQEVAWLVNNHLLLSKLAFRRNASDLTTWSELLAIGASNDRLRLLLLLTAVDIRATNLETWNAWKEDLLIRVVRSMESPQGERFRLLKKEAEKLTDKNKRAKILNHLSNLDPILVESVSAKTLIKDLHSVMKIKKSSLALFNDGANQYWVRFFTAQDEVGLVAKYVRSLYQSGCAIHTSIIQTIPDFGVYDWFQIRSKQPKQRILSWLEKSQAQSQNPPSEVKPLFDSIEVISEGENEIIIEFKGRDQKGLLMAAVAGLAKEGFDIRWAKIQTWGKRVEDIFCCLKKLDTTTRLDRLRESLIIKNP